MNVSRKTVLISVLGTIAMTAFIQSQLSTQDTPLAYESQGNTDQQPTRRGSDTARPGSMQSASASAKTHAIASRIGAWSPTHAAIGRKKRIDPFQWQPLRQPKQPKPRQRVAINVPPKRVVVAPAPIVVSAPPPLIVPKARLRAKLAGRIQMGNDESIWLQIDQDIVQANQGESVEPGYTISTVTENAVHFDNAANEQNPPLRWHQPSGNITFHDHE